MAASIPLHLRAATLLGILLSFLVPPAAAEHGVMPLEISFDESPAMLPVGASTLRGVIEGPCGTDAIGIEMDVVEAPSWAWTVKMDGPRLVDACGVAAKERFEFAIHVRRVWLAPAGSVDEFEFVATAGSISGGHARVEGVMPYAGDVMVTFGGWRQSEDGLVRDMIVANKGNAPTTVRAASHPAVEGLEFPDPLELGYEIGRPMGTIAAVWWRGDGTPPVTPVHIETWQTDTGAPGPSFETELWRSISTPVGAWESTDPLLSARASALIVAIGFLVCAVLAIGYALSWRGAPHRRAHPVQAPEIDRPPFGVRWIYVRLTAFARIPIPEGPPAYHVGAIILKAACWIAVGIVVTAVVAILVFIRASAGAGLAAIGYAFAVAGALIIFWMAFGLGFVANAAYFMWVARTRFALWAVRLAGTGMMAFSGFMLMVLFLGAFDIVGAAFGVALSAWFVAGGLLVAATLDPSTRAIFPAPASASAVASAQDG